ncbi:AAA family ATPase [Paenibacillus sp. N3.4]|uniref:AAA family ATPase n=1 Tax=Paenibacillus sp. N3.4 TaxID=2603222 RepID=UPI0011C8CBAE|nr:AAA family ATPase [Paenibacillus sp. N3.4]TXK84514.1 ATP-binding protein [Paenibacillus sp. N3.4]
MRKLVLILGPAGAGKTTMAKALASKHGGAFLDMDTLLRPAAEAIMTLAGQDPSDRDSPFYKTHCRDLGYRITMDAALENIGLGLDAYVVGPFTKEIAEAKWVETELSRIGATVHDVELKVIYVYLSEEQVYRQRIQERGLPIDHWKLNNWDDFRHSLIRREIKWHLDASSILYWDNSEMLSSEKLQMLERFVYGERL